jgi:imidazolonepropionase-like amidohydrolase
VIALAQVLVGAIAIVGAKVEVGDGSVLEHATVVVDGGKIVSINGAVPANADKIEASGKWLTPGLVAAQAEAGLVEVDAEKSSNDTRLSMQTAPAFRAIDGFNPLSPRIAIDRAQGVTSMVLSPRGALIHGQGFVVDTSGSLDIHSKRAAMFASFAGAAKSEAGGARGGVLLRLREILDDVRFYAKNKAAYDKAGARELSLPRVELEAMIDVVEGKLPIVFEVNRASDILELLAFAKEQKLSVVVDGGREAWVVAAQLADAKVPVIVEPMAMMPYGFDSLRARDDAPAILSKAGVPLIIASGGGDLGTTRLRQQAGVAVANGMTHEAALASITSTPAKIFGVDDVGTIAIGKRADLVLWSGDPFETTTSAEVVMIGGERTSLVTRQTELVRKYRVLK